MDLSNERWDGASRGEREVIARHLAKQLPLGFTFQTVYAFQLGEHSRHVALYKNGDATFALIPGGSVSLGYDEQRPLNPNPDELESWQGTAEENGIALTLQEYVTEVTTRVRRVELHPFLVETEAKELGWEPIGLDEPQVRSILREHAGKLCVEVSDGSTSTRVRIDQRGQVTAERSLACTHAELVAQFAASGFRFPTSDEWEYACGGGAPTLFRWGDHVPCDRYPTDISTAEASWRRQWALSAGKLERPTVEFKSDWDYHRTINAFGLLIASNPYKCELVAEIGVTRGGDEGCTICGGTGFYVGWLTLATAYFEEHFCKHDPTEPISPGYTIGRRVIALH